MLAALRPVALTTSTFLEAVEEQSQAWSRRTGIHLEVRAEGLSALPPAVEEALFRVVQEALDQYRAPQRSHRSAPAPGGGRADAGADAAR